MELRVLGPLELVGSSGVVALGGKVRAILALLAVQVGETVSEARLIEALWGESAPRTATKTLQSYVSRLRRLLGDADDGLAVETTPGGYRLRAAVDVLDVARVEALAARAREAAAQGDHPWAAVALSEALRTWRGVPLEEFAGEPWAAAESARLAELRDVLVEERVEAELACGRHAALVPELEALTAQHPLRERLWGQRMIALYRSGRQADALRVYQHVRRHLADELGIEPGHDLRRLEQRLLDQDRALDWVPSATATDKPDPIGLPSGLVTFLLTDIEGSAALWEHDPRAMTAALARHDGLVREAVEANGGALIKSRGEGDSSFSVFRTAEAAATAAMAIQTTLASVGGGLRVRIGIHTGEAEERDGDYFGPTVNRAARLRDAAHGGQTVCSSVTGNVLLDGIPSVEVTDLGEHRLRDLGRVDRIFQLGGGAFPPLRTVDARRHNLPAHATEFVGRVDDVEKVGALLREHRLVVLTGVGGVGKTRLAIEVATSVFEELPDGVFFVDLAPVSDPDLVVPTIAGVLPIGLTAEPASEVLGFLAQRRALVVLDNCEHLVDACAQLLTGLLARGGAGRVLATTREAFGLAGERVWQVASLGGEESRDLFAVRAGAIRQLFAVDESNATAVDEICRRLDGIPLAIELAAARIAHLSPRQIADRLGDRFALLTGGRGRVQRQHTLQAALDWSHDLLSSTEQVLLRRLGVFNGSFSLEAVEGICTDDELASTDVLDVLGALVNQSLVEAEDDGRYRLLETVRLYAEQRLAASGEGAELRDRHLRWYVEWTESLVTATDRTTEASARIALELGNVSASVSWALSQERNDDAGRLAVATAPMWMYSSRSHEASHWLRAALLDPDALSPDLRVACYACLAHAGMMIMTDDVFHLARSAVRVEGAEPSGPLALAWGTLANMAGSRAAVLGQPDDPRLDEAVARARSTHHQRDFWRAEALNLCAEGLLSAGRLAESLPLATASLECAADVQFLQVAWNSRSISMVAWHLLGNHERAMAEAERLRRDRTLVAGVASTSFGAHEAVVLAAGGQHELAREIVLQALASTDDPAIPLWEAEVLLTLAVVEAISGRARRAAVLLAAGRALGRHLPGGFRTPMSWALYRHYLPVVRAALTAEEAKAARDEGRAMTLDAAIRYAFDDVASTAALHEEQRATPG